jgi:hypothetical protein
VKKPVGGLKLALEGVRHDDRRVRFAPVAIASVGSADEIKLVTDSHGRMRYRLAAGEYRLRLEEAGETPFAVGGDRWTMVRLRLR